MSNEDSKYIPKKIICSNFKCKSREEMTFKIVHWPFDPPDTSHSQFSQSGWILLGFPFYCACQPGSQKGHCIVRFKNLSALTGIQKRA